MYNNIIAIQLMYKQTYIVTYIYRLVLYIHIYLLKATTVVYIYKILISRTCIKFQP